NAQPRKYRGRSLNRQALYYGSGVGRGCPRGGGEAGAAGGGELGLAAKFGTGTRGTSLDSGGVAEAEGAGEGVFILAMASSSSFFSSTKIGPFCAASMYSLAASN